MGFLKKIILRFGVGLLVFLPLGILASSTQSTKDSLSVYGPTKDQDTLWHIATVMLPDSNVSIQQTMLALMANNPSAFVCNNVNGLKSGFVLHLPSLLKIKKVSSFAALHKVEQQLYLWKNNQGLRHAKCLSQKPKKNILSAKRKKFPRKITLQDGQQFLGSAKIVIEKMVTPEQIDALESKLSLVNTELQAFKQLTDGDILVLKTKNDDLQQRLSSVNQEMQAVQVKLTELSDAQKALQEKYKNNVILHVGHYVQKVCSLMHGFVCFGILLGLCLVVFLSIKVGKCKKCRVLDNQASGEQPQISTENKSSEEKKIEPFLQDKVAAKEAVKEVPVKKEPITKEVVKKSEREFPKEKEEIVLEGYDFLSSQEGFAAKLDLARIYIDMDDTAKAETVLKDVVDKGSPEQKQEARKLLRKIKAKNDAVKVN